VSAAVAAPSTSQTRPQLGFWTIAGPTIAGQLAASVAGIVDLKIVGLLGASPLAAVGAGLRLFITAQAVLVAVSAGTTALVARAMGAGDRNEADQVTRTSLLLGVGLGAMLSVLGVLFADPLAHSFGLEEETTRETARFIRTVSLFNVGLAAFNVMGASLRASGDARTPLFVGVAANVMNAALVYALVLGNFGAPRLGVTGAAIATGTSFLVSGIALTALWWYRATPAPAVRDARRSRARTRQLLRIGGPAAIEQAFWQGGLVAFLYVIADYGDAAFAAYGLGTQILSFSFVIGFGFGISSATLVGQHLGAGDPQSARESGWRAMRWSIWIMMIVGALIMLGNRTLAGLLVADPEVLRLTSLFLLVLGAVQPLMAIEFTLAGSLRGAGDTRYPLFTTLVGLFGFRFTLAMAASSYGLDIAWVYSALIADYIAKATLLVSRFRSDRWQRALDRR